MVNGDLSHSTWPAPQLDEPSLLQEPRAQISRIIATMAALTSLPRPRGVVGEWAEVSSVCHISPVTRNGKQDVRGEAVDS